MLAVDNIVLQSKFNLDIFFTWGVETNVRNKTKIDFGNFKRRSVVEMDGWRASVEVLGKDWWRYCL